MVHTLSLQMLDVVLLLLLLLVLLLVPAGTMANAL
jgi:hypothetical protein